MKLGQMVWIPQGYFPNGATRPYSQAEIIGGYSRILYGRSTVYVVKDQEGQWLLDELSIKEEKEAVS